MLRRASVFVAIVCLLGVGVASATTYTITDLGNLGAGASGGVITPAAVARVGGNVEVVGSGQTNASQFYYDGFYWTQGSGLVDFGSAVSTLSGITWGGTNPTSTSLGFAATGINASGQIVGYYGINSDNGTGGTGSGGHNGGFSYTIGNSAIDMKCPSTTFGGVGTVNSSGQVAATDFVGISPTTHAGLAYANGITAGVDFGAARMVRSAASPSTTAAWLQATVQCRTRIMNSLSMTPAPGTILAVWREERRCFAESTPTAM